MSELQIKNHSVASIHVKFNDEEARKLPPGMTHVTEDIGTFSVSKSKTEVFHGVFSGIANVRIKAEETGVNARFIVKNDNEELEVVVTYGAHVDRIEPHKSNEFNKPGKYHMSFPEKNSDNSESLRGIVTIEFPEDVDNVMMHVA